MARIWTKELAELTARKYTSIKELADNDWAAYWSIQRHGWLHDFPWLKHKQTWKDITDVEEIKAVALKCTSKSEFKIHFKKYYRAAQHLNILNELKYSKRIIIENFQTPHEETESDDKINYVQNVPCLDVNALDWKVYVYEFDNYVYIGLTNNLKRRDYEHCKRKRDSLYKWCQEHNIVLSRNSYILKKDNLTAQTALIQEDIIKEEYKSSGWTIINKGKTGKGSSSLGSLFVKWDKETCYKEALKYTLYKDFHKKASRAYNVSIKNGWLKDYTWLIKTTELLKKPILQFDLENNFIAEYNCASEIYVKLGFNKFVIQKVCNPNNTNRRTAYGFIWKYKEDCI